MIGTVSDDRVDYLQRAEWRVESAHVRNRKELVGANGPGHQSTGANPKCQQQHDRHQPDGDRPAPHCFVVLMRFFGDGGALLETQGLDLVVGLRHRCIIA